jgi:hypothetical protein
MKGLNAFADASSMHGIKYVLSENRKKSTRMFWTSAIFLSACGLGYYVYNSTYKFVYDPEIVMKARDRNAIDFPAPAVTICSNLFAKDELANLFYIVHNANAKRPFNVTKKSCEYLAANIQWCQPKFAHNIYEFICQNQSFHSINVLKMINESALNIKQTFQNCEKGECERAVLRVFTDYGICFVRNTLSFSSIFNTDVIHDDFKCYLKFFNDSGNIVEDVSPWTPERGYESPDVEYPYRVTRNLEFTFRPRLTAIEKENLCGLKNFRVYFHKPNEILTPFHESIFLNFDEVRKVLITLITILMFRYFPVHGISCVPKKSSN